MATSAPPAPPGLPETEWQFDALDLRPVASWLVSGHNGWRLFVIPGAADDQVDTYCDTPDWRFHRAGYGLRLRLLAGQTTATLKTLAEAQDGLRRRREISEALPAADLDSLRNAPGPVGQRVRLVAGSKPVQALFEVHTHRQKYTVMLDGLPAAAIALDSTSVPVGEAAEPFRLRRVEVEVAEASLADLQPFVEGMRADCGLQTAILSKYDLGLFARGLQPAGLPDLGPTAVDAAQTLGETAYAILRRHFAALLSNEPGTRLGDDPEELHDMRVAVRRLRAAMRLFAEALPARAARLRQELRWVAGALGEVRDLDVQLIQIQTWAAQADPRDREAWQALAALIEGRRANARRRMMRALDSVRYERLIAAYTAMLQRGPARRSPVGRTPVLEAAPPMISGRYRKVRKIGDHIDETSPPEAYHALRIQCKQLRYALEFFREIYGKHAEELIRRLVALQDILGRHQDACVATASLREMSQSYSRRLPPQAVFVMGGLAERYTEQAGELRSEFPKAFQRFKGRPWRRLHRAMQLRRLDAPARPRRRSSTP
jgi:CHAD domain-containing protein